MFLMAAMVWYGISLEPRRAPSTGDSALFYEDEYARAAGGAYINEDAYVGGGYHGMGTMSTLYGDRTMQRRQVAADTYGSEFYPAGGAVMAQQLPYSVPGSGTLGRRTIGSASTMGRGATLPKIAITPAGNGNLRQRNHVAVATSTLPRSGSAVAHATVGPDVSYLETDDAQKATADWVIHSSTQHLAAESSNHTDENGAAMHLEDDDDEVVPAAGNGLMQSSSFTKSFVVEQTVDGSNVRNGGKTGTNMSYRSD